MDEELDNLFADVFKQQPAEPTAENPADATAGDTAPGEGSDTGEKGGAPTPAEQQAEPPEEERRSRNAEKRIRREQRIAEEARNAERTRTSELLKRLGIEKPDGGTIDSVEDLEEYDRSQTDARVPGGKPAADAMRRIVRETMRETAQPPRENDEVDRQLEMIREMDPEMKDLGTILSSDIGESFRRHVDNGATFVQAYGRAKREISAKAAGASAASAAKTAGKGHLAGTTTRGAGALSVPAEVKSIWRALIPDDSEEEIQKYYNKDRKRLG